MSDDREHDKGEGFFRRWSRVKGEAREDGPETPQSAPPVDSQPAVDPAEAAPQLPALDELTFESDFRGFFHPKVDEDLRRGALRKLFSDPHFNVMDGLDVYIDDYSKPDPLPEGWLEKMNQVARLGDFTAREAEKAEEARVAADSQQLLAAECVVCRERLRHVESWKRPFAGLRERKKNKEQGGRSRARSTHV